MFTSFISCCAINLQSDISSTQKWTKQFYIYKKNTVNIYNWGNRILYDRPSAIETTLQNISKQSYQPVKMINISKQKRHAFFINISGDVVTLGTWKIPLQWRHNERDGVSNHQLTDCLLNRLFRRRSKKTSKLRVTGLCAGKFIGERHNEPVTRKMFSLWWEYLRSIRWLWDYFIFISLCLHLL